jgi:phosphoribosylglycinamide formyltransferase-1
VRIAVLVSGEGSNLQALLDTVHGHEVEIACVASDRAGAPAIARAEAAGVPVAVFHRDGYPDRTTRDAALGDWLVEHGAQLVVLAGYMALLTPDFVARFPDRIINVHPSLLPAFPGVRAVQQAIDGGARVVGVTVHLVDEGVDTGAILLQRAIPMPDDTDSDVVHAALRPLEHELLPQAVRLFAQGLVRRDPVHPARLLSSPSDGR